MSGKKAKAERKDLKERVDAFMAVITDASRKFQVGLFPVIQYFPDGLRPNMQVVDEAGKYGAVTDEAKKQNELEKAGKVAEPEKPVATQIET